MTESLKVSHSRFSLINQSASPIPSNITEKKKSIEVNIDLTSLNEELELYGSIKTIYK